MKIDKIINKWFEEAKAKLSGGKTYYTQSGLDVDSLCLGVVALLENYVHSVLSLLNAGKKLPAKALLRVISDMSIKCMWCLKGLEKDLEEFSKRLDIWRRYSLSKDKKRMQAEIDRLEQNYDNSVSQLVGRLKRFVEILEKEGISNNEKMPSIWDMREIWENQADMNFDALYRRFHQGIHPDWMVLQLLKKKDGDKILYEADIEESTEGLKKFCLMILGYLLRAIYSVNKWDLSDFEEDIDKIRGLDAK
jgi:hypothetical protein